MIKQCCRFENYQALQTTITLGLVSVLAGDVNDDGYDDVIAGASKSGVSPGKAYIFLGSSTMDSTSDVILTGETPGSQFGCSVSSAGDMNDDNYADVVVGAKSYNNAAELIFFWVGV